MDIKNLKIFKVISSFLIVTIFTTFIINDYSYALTAKPISDLATIRKSAGYDKSFSYIGLQEENAINKNAKSFVNTISDTYNKQKERLEDNFETKKSEVISNKNAKNETILQEAEKNKTTLTESYKKNRSDYESTYNEKKASVTADYNSRIEQMQNTLASLKETKAIQDKTAANDAALASESSKASNLVNQVNTGGLAEKPDSSEIGSDSTASGSNTAAKIQKLEKKLASVKSQKEKDLASLDKRADYAMSELEAKYLSDIKSLQQRTDGYVSSLENLTNTELQKLEENNQKSLNTLYENSNQEINSYLFAEKSGLYTKAYDYDSKSIMRDLKLDSDTKSGKETKIDGPTGGYIGDLEEYNSIEQQKQIYLANQYLAKAEKLLDSGSSDGVARAAEYTAAAGVVNKDAEVLMPMKYNGTNGINEPIDMSLRDGKANGSTVDSSIITLNKAEEAAKERLLSDADEMIAESDKMIEDIKKGQENSTQTATDEMAGTTNQAVEDMNSMTMQEMQELLNFVYELEGYLDMVWPKDAGAEYARKQEAIQEAEKLIEEEQANVKWAIAGLVISAVMIIVSLVVIIVKWVAGTGLVIAGLAFCAALLPCVGIPMIAGGSILIALAVVAAVVALAGLITSIVFLVTAQNRLSKAIAVRDKLQQELSSLETAMLGGATKSATETDAEWAARKMGQNTSYSRYLAAQADYNKAMENFKAMFYDEFGLFAEKKVRKMIDKIKKLMGSRNLSDLSKEELVKLQELLFYFKHASKNKKLLASMSDLKIKYAAYQQRLKELKEDQTLIKYTDRDGKEIEITMAAAYEHMNYLNAMLSYLGEVIKYEYEHADTKTKIWIAMNNMYTYLGGGTLVGDFGNGQYTKQYAGVFTIAIQAVTGFFSYIFGNVVGIFTGETLGWSDYWGEADEAGNLRGKNAKNFEGAAAWGAKVGSVFGKYVASMTIGLFKAIVVDNFLQAKNTMTMYAENFRKYGFWKGLGESAKGILYMPFNLLGSLIGFKQGWLQAVIDGKSFKEAAGLNSFDDWITNWNPGEVAGMVINLAGTAGAGATGALKAAFSWTVAVAKGIVSVIKGIGTMVVNAVKAMFKWVASGGIFTGILKGIVATVATIGLVAVAAVAITAIVVAAPVILTAVVVADVVKTVIKEGYKAIKNIVNTIKNIGKVAGTFGKTVSAIFKAAWNFVKDTAVKIVGKIKELWAGGFWSKVGAVLTAIALPVVVGLAAIAAVTTAVVATVALGVVTVIGGDNSAKLLKDASDAIIDAVKGGGSALKAFGTLLKSTGKLLLNALTDMDADAFSAATGGQKALQIMQGISSFIQNVGAIAMLTTGGIGGLFLGVGLKIVGKWYNENILGQKYSRKYEASKAVEDLFGADNLKGSTNLNVSEDQVSTLKQLIDAQGYVVVDIDGVATRLNSTEFDVYVAKGGDVARVQIEVNGELKTFTFSSGEGTNSASQLKNLILQGMSSASLRLLQDEISKNNKNDSAKETFAMISKELLQRTDIGKVLNLSTELSKEGNKTPLDLDDEGVAFIENKRKQIQELLDLEASTKSSDWEKSKQKKELTKLMEEVDQLQVKIGGQDYTLRELRNLTGVDISVEIIKNGKDLGDIKSIIKNVLSSPTVIQNIQETVVIRTKSYTDMVEVNKTVQEAKKKLKEEMETDLESKAKELEDTKKQIVENDANIQKKQDELKKLMNDLDGNLDEDVKTQIKNLEDEIKSSQTRRDDLDNDMQVLKSDIDDLQKTISDVSMRMSESKSVSKKIQSEIDSDVEQKTKLEDELQKIKDDNDEVIARKSRLEQEDQDLDNQKKVLDEDNDAIVKQIDDLKRKEAEQKKVLEDAENDFNQKKEEVEELNKQIQQKEKETDLEVARKKQQIADNAEEIENLKKEIEEQKQKQKLEMDEEIAAKTKDINAKYNKEKKQLQEIKKLILKYKNGDDRVKNDLIVAFRRGSDLARNLELTDGFYAEVMKKDGLKNLLTRIESLDSDLNYAKSQALSEIDIPISNEIKNLQSKISALENQNTRLSRSIDSSDSGLSSLKSKLQAETANLGKMQSKLESIKSSQPVDFDGQIQILTKKIESNNSQIADISIRKVSLKSEISSLKIRDTADLSSKITDLSRKIEINQTSLDENNALIKKYGEDLDQINEKYEMKKDEYTRKDKEKENLDQKLQDDTDSIEKIKNESSQSKIDKLNKEIEELQGQKKLFDTKAELEKNIGELQTKYKSLDSGTVEDLYKNLKEKYGVEGKTAKDYPELKYGEFDQIKKTLETLETTLSGGKLDGLGKTGVKLVESMGGETAESFYKSQYGQILNRYNDAGLFSEERKQLKELMKKYDQTGTKLEFKREAQEALKMKENLDTEQVKKLNIEKELAVIESMQKDLDSDTLSTKELKSKIKAIKEANNDINTAILKDMESIRHQQDKILKTQMDSTMEDVGDFIKKGKNKEKFLQDIEEQITKSLDNEGKNKIEAVKAKKELANQELENLKQDPKLNAKKILSLEKHIQNLEEAETNIFKSHISEDFQKLKQTISSLDDSTPVSERSKIMEEYRKLMAKSLDGDIAVREQENSLAVQKLADKMSELQATKIQAQNKLDALEKQRADILRKGENSSDIDKLIEKEKMGIKIGFAEINKQIESFNKQITDLKISQQKSIISAPQLDIRRAIYNNISFENFTAENISNYNKLSKLTKENIVSGVKSGELAIASYKYQYGGKEVALTNKGISGFIKENISSDTYLFKGLIARGNKERLLEEYEGKEKRDTEGKKAKNITIEELKSGKEMKKILEGEEVGIIDKIIKEGKFSDKEKAIKVLEAEIEALKEDPDGKTFKFFNKTTTKNKIEALENIVKSLKDGKEGEGVKAYLQESGDYGLRVLKAGGFDADYKLESQLHMAKVRKETFNRLGTVISESEIVKADPSRSLKSNVEILLIEQGLYNEKRKDTLSEIDVRNEEGGKALKEVAEEIMTKEIDADLGKGNVIEKLKGKMTEVDSAKYSEISKKVSGSWTEEEVSFVRNTEKELLKNASASDLRDLSQTLRADDPLQSVLNKTIVAKDLEYQAKSIEAPFKIQRLNSQANDFIGMTDLTARSKIRDIISKAKDQNDPEVQIAKKVELMLDGKLDLGEVFDEMQTIMKQGKNSDIEKMFVSKGMQAVNREINGLVGDKIDSIKDTISGQFKTRGDIKGLNDDFKKYISTEVENAKKEYFSMLDRETARPMEKMFALMKESIKNTSGDVKIKVRNEYGVETGAEVKISEADAVSLDQYVRKTNYEILEKQLGDDLTFDKIIKEVFDGQVKIDSKGRANFTKMQSDVYRAMILKIEEGHYTHKEGNRIVSSRETLFSDTSNMSQSQNQLLMMNANDAGEVAALGMGGGKTRVYPLVIASQMLSGKSGMAEILVSAKQEVSNMLGVDASGNTSAMKRFFGVDMQNGTEGNDVLAGQLKNANDKTIFVFDIETRGHLSHEVRHNSDLKSLMKIGTIAIDEADALALRQQSFINAERSAASYDIKYQAVKILETYDEVLKTLREKDPDIDSKAFVQDGSGTNTMDPAVLKEMLKKIGKDDIMEKGLYKSGLVLDRKNRDGQYQYMIEQVLRARKEVMGGETTGGYKTDSVSGIQYGVQDGVDLNSVATQVLEAYNKNGGKVGDFSRDSFESVTKTRLGEFKAEVSKTTVEASSQEILTRDAGIEINVFGGSGTTWGAKRISNALAAPVVELAEGTFAEYGYKTKVLGDKKSSTIAAEFANGEVGESNWGKLLIQDHRSIKDNLIETLKGKVKDTDPSISDFIETVSKITGKTDRVSTAELASDLGADGKIIDKVFNKEGGGYRSLGELIRTGEVEYKVVEVDGVQQKQFVARDGHVVQVSAMDILKSRSVIDTMLGEGKGQGVVDALGTKKIYVIDNYTKAENVTPLAKQVSANEWTVYATNKAGRGMDFRGKMKLLVLDSENIPKNDLLQILGRAGRGASRDTFSREVVVNTNALKTRFEEAREVINAEKAQMEKSKFFKEAQEAFNGGKANKQQQQIMTDYNNLNKKLSNYDTYIEEINSGGVPKSSVEMVQDSSVIVGQQKANGSSLYQIGEGVRSALLKIPLEQMMTRANPKDRIKLQKAVDELVRKARGQEAELLRQMDAEFKDPKEIFKKIMESNLKAAEDVFKVLSSDTFSSKATRKEYFGDSEGIVSKDLKAELKARRNDLHNAQKLLNKMMDNDWQELRFETKSKAESSGIYTMSQINSSDSPFIASQVLDTAAYIARDLTPQRKNVSPEQAIKSVKIVNSAMTGNSNTGAIMFKTNDANIIATQIEDMMVSGSKKISQIHLTPQQFTAIQNTPIARQILETANNSRSFNQSSWWNSNRGKVKIYVSKNEEQIKQGNVISYNEAVARTNQNISLTNQAVKTKMQAQAIQMQMNQLIRDQQATVVTLGVSSEDRNLDERAKKLFERQIKSEKFGISEEIWSKKVSDDAQTSTPVPIIVKVDADRWDGMSVKEQEDFKTKFRAEAQLRKEQGQGEMHLFVSSSRLQDVKEKKAIAEQLASAKTEEQKEQAYIAIEDSYRLELKSKEQEEKEKIRQAIILKQKAEAEIKKLEMESRSKESEIMDQKIDVWNSKENKQKEEERKRLIIERQKLQKQQEKLKDEEEILKQKKSLLVRDQYRLEQVRQDLKQENQNITKERQSVRNLKQEEEQLRQEKKQLRQEEDLLMQKKQELENEKKSIEREEASVGSSLRKAENESEINDNQRNLTERKSQILQKQEQLVQKQTQLGEKQEQLVQKQTKMGENQKLIVENQGKIKQKKTEIAENVVAIEVKGTEVKEKQAVIESKGKEIDKNKVKIKMSRFSSTLASIEDQDIARTTLQTNTKRAIEEQEQRIKDAEAEIERSRTEIQKAQTEFTKKKVSLQVEGLKYNIMVSVKNLEEEGSFERKERMSILETATKRLTGIIEAKIKPLQEESAGIRSKIEREQKKAKGVMIEKGKEVQQMQLQQRYIENSRKLFGADISEYIKMGTLEEVEEEIQKLQTEEEHLEQETENMEKEESIVDYGVGVLQGEIDTDEEDLVKENELKEKEFSFLEIQQKLVKIEEVKQKKQILDERLEILRSMDPKILKEYVVENAYNQEASLEKEFGTLTEGVYSVEATDYGVLLASTSDEMVDKWTKAETERRKEIFNAENKGIKGQIKEGYWESVSSDMSGFTGWIHSFPSWSKDVWGRTGSWNTFRGAIVKIGICLSWIGYILAYPLMWIAKGLFSITANFVEKLFGSDVLEYKEDEATTVGKGFHSMTWWQKTLFILGNIVTLGGVSVSYTIIKKSGYEGKTGFGKFGMIILGILTSIPFISHIIALLIAAKMKDNSLLLETKSIQLEIFRQAKRDLKEGKITQTEYKDLIAMETEQMLMDRYIRNSLTDEVLEIKVSAEKSEINNEAIRQGIKKFNEKKRMLISTEVPKNMPKAIVIKDTKGNIVDIYSRERQEQKYKENGEEDGVILIDTGELQSRNEDLQKVLSGGQADMSQFAGMFGGMDLSSFGKPKTIKPKKIRTNAKREQQEEIMKELRQTKSGAVIIDLDNVAEENIDDITSFILREVSESKEITKNVVFMKNGKYFGATDQKVSEKIKEWDTKLKGLGIKTPSIKFNYKNIDLESAQMKPNFDEKYISEQVSLGELENLGNLVYGDTNTRAYLDTKFRDENGEEKELFTLEVSDSKVKVKINEKSIDVLSIDSNRVKLMQRLRQIEMQYRDLQKGIEIELPEIKEGTSLDDLDKEAERQKALAATKIARGKVKNTCEFFVAEMAGIKEQSNRKFVLMNDRGNILRVNNPGLFGILGTDLQGQKVLVAPDYVLTNEVLFKEWLSRMLRSEEMTEMQGDIIVGLEKAEILPIAIQGVLTKSFNNERMKFINRKGEIVRSFIEEEKAKTILDKNEILILNPRLNSRIETSMKTVNWETVKVVKISDELAKSPKQINDLMTLLTRYGYQGDIEVLANNGSSVKLWQEKMFGEGVLVRDVSDTKEFDEILESLEKYNEKLGKTEISQYASTPIVLNINAREKLERVHTHWALSIFTLGILPIVRYFRADNKLRRINKLIEEGVFGNITIMQRGEIVATNDSQILARDKQFEQLRENQIFELRARNKDIKDDLSKSKDLLFTTIDKEQKEKDAEKQKVRVFEKGITSPVYRGNVVMNMKGADDFIKQQTALLTKTTEQLTEKDIVELSTQSANAVRTYGIDFAMESRVKMKSDKSNTLTNARYLDTAA